MPAMTRPEPRGVSASDDFREQQRADFRAAMCREYEERVKQQAAAQFIMAMKASAPTERKTGLLAHAWVERARKSLEQSPIEAELFIYSRWTGSRRLIQSIRLQC